MCSKSILMVIFDEESKRMTYYSSNKKFSLVDAFKAK